MVVIVSRARCALAVYSHTRVVSCGSSVDTFTPSPHTHCRNVDDLGGKTLVMNLVNHGNSEVRMQALLAIQKMMVQNWLANLIVTARV